MPTEYFDALEIFHKILDSEGISVSTTKEGVFLGITVAKLKEFLAIAEGSSEKKVLMLIARPPAGGTNN